MGMRIKQYSVQVVPQQGTPYYVVVGGVSPTDAWSKALQIYPGCSCIVRGEV